MNQREKFIRVLSTYNLSWQSIPVRNKCKGILNKRIDFNFLKLCFKALYNNKTRPDY